MAASCFLSGLVTYFCISNLFSSPFLCRLENTALDHDLFLLYVCGIVSFVRTAYGPERHEEDVMSKLKEEQKLERALTAGVSQPQTESWTGPASCLLQSYMWWLPGKVSWNWCWPDCLLLLPPSELIMEGASLIPGSMEEKYWLAGGWTGMWIPDWRFALTMDVRSVTEREMMSYRSDTTSGVRDGLVFTKTILKIYAWLRRCLRATLRLHCCCLWLILTSDLSSLGGNKERILIPPQGSLECVLWGCCSFPTLRTSAL